MNQPSQGIQYSNFVQIKPGVYLTRTGAGFRKALRRFGIPFEDFKNVVGPTSFPCIVFLYKVIENNVEIVKCSSAHLNVLYAALEQTDSQEMAVQHPHHSNVL